MDTKAIDFKLLHEDGALVGFTLTAEGQTEAESFCYSFPAAVKDGRAAVAVVDEKMVFTHQGHNPPGETDPRMCSDPGEYVVELSSENATALRHVLACAGPYDGKRLHVARVATWGYGFSLMVR